MPQDRHGPQIDLIVRGLNRGSGRSQDRFRVSAETTDPALVSIYKAMVRELARRIGGLDLLRACADGRFGIAELHRAYAQGPQALADLLARKRQPPLAELAAAYLQQYKRQSKARTQQRIERFLTWLGPGAALAAFTKERVAAFLDDLQTVKVNVETQREASAATKNRYFMALYGFASWLVDTDVLAKHPLKGASLYDEGARRIRYFTPEEYRAYFRAIEADRPELVPVFKLLAHTGADIGEVVETALANGTRSHPLRVRDLHFDRDLPRVLFKRSKVDDSPERLVPVPDDVAEALKRHVERHGLRLQDPLFGMFTDMDLRYAHARARTAIGREDMRRKDLRHVAAVLWRRAGVDLDRIREWLGHADIAQTMVYAGFGPDDAYDAPAIKRVTEFLTAKPSKRDEDQKWRKIA